MHESTYFTEMVRIAFMSQENLSHINDKGEARVVDLSGEKGQIVGESTFNETIQSSPAVAGNALFIRSDKHLWKVAEKP